MGNRQALTDHVQESGFLLYDDAVEFKNSMLVTSVPPDSSDLEADVVAIGTLDCVTRHGAFFIVNNWNSLAGVIDALWSAGEQAFGPYVEE